MHPIPYDPKGSRSCPGLDLDGMNLALEVRTLPGHQSFQGLKPMGNHSITTTGMAIARRATLAAYDWKLEGLKGLGSRGQTSRKL